MNTPVLQIKNLTKAYKGNVNVIQNLHLNVPRGKIVGLLGPNGCGKTTLLKLIAGLLAANEGEIYVDGERICEKTNGLISYLPDKAYFSNKMKVFELLNYFEDFYADFDRNLAEKMLADLGINLKATLKTLSKGTKEKVQLVLVMARRAKLYMLDEPIGGVDPAAREYILNTIINNYNPEASVIITTHLITDIETALDEFIFMGYGGQVLMVGNCDQVREKTGKSLDELFKEVFRCSANV